MKKKAAIILWNALVDALPIIIPLVIQHKDTIIKKAKKIKLN